MQKNEFVGNAEAHPNLALVKYWGKSNAKRFLPATPSIGIALKACVTKTRVVAWLVQENNSSTFVSQSLVKFSWNISINGSPQNSENYTGFFRAFLRHLLQAQYIEPSAPVHYHFRIESENNFPTASGLASSASGFAALAGALNESLSRALGADMSLPDLSACARWGSVSASRAVFGGFVSLLQGAERAEQLFDCSYWSELRCLIVITSAEEKSVSSRNAMAQTQSTSPYYSAWIQNAPQLYSEALKAIQNKDIEALGRSMRRSYLRMFATIFACNAPIVYWKPESLAIITLLERLRLRGIPAYETMDAGPQVKILTLSAHCSEIAGEIRALNPRLECIASEVGGNLRAW